jgi:hypothetical protein
MTKMMMPCFKIRGCNKNGKRNARSMRGGEGKGLNGAREYVQMRRVPCAHS